MGLCVADALGVPVEFMSREKLEMNPVIDMRGLGTHNQPVGTWSDDTSMTLCLVDSLTKGLDYSDIMCKFQSWLKEGAYTPHGEVFDIGIATRQAIMRFVNGTEPLKCGGIGEHAAPPALIIVQDFVRTPNPKSLEDIIVYWI